MNRKSKSKVPLAGVGLVIGAGIGVAVTAAIGWPVYWAGAGAAFGLIVGAILESAAEKNNGGR